MLMDYIITYLYFPKLGVLHRAQQYAIEEVWLFDLCSNRMAYACRWR